LDFRLEISGTKKIKDELEAVSDRLQRLAAIANALDGKDVNIEANVDKDGSLDQTLETVRTLDGFEFDADGSSLTRELERSLDDVEFDPEVDAASIRSQIKAAVEAGDFDADIDTNLAGSRLAGGLAETDIDRDASGGLSGVSRALRSQSLSENLSRLNDEAFAVASIIGNLGGVIAGTTAGIAALGVAAGAGVAAVGGLAAAATALATKFGDQQLRQSLTSLQVLFEGVARDFVESFQEAGIFENQLFPAAREFASVLRSQIPVLTRFVQDNLPSLLDAVISLTEKIDGLAVLFDSAINAFDVLIESLEITFLEAGPALLEQFLDDAGFGDAAPDFFREALEESVGSIQSSVTDPGPGVARGGQQFRAGSARPSAARAPGFEGVPTKATEKLRELQREIDAARLKEEKLATFTERDLQESLVKSYEKGVDKLLAIKQQTGQLPAATDDWIRKLERAQQKLTQLEEGRTIPQSIQRLEEATEVPSAQEVSSLSASPSVGGTRTSLGQLRQIAESADSVREINTLIQQARQEFDLLANREALQFVGRLQKAKQELQETNQIAQAARDALSGAVDQLSQGIGQSVGDALFADQGRLNRLRGRRRQIQQNLRQARQAGNVQQIRQLSSELDRVNQKLKQSETLAGRLGQAFRNFGQVAKQALESFVSEVVQAIAKIAALKIISSFLGGPLGGAGGIVGGGLGGGGGGGLLPGSAIAASGGFVEEGGLARIHKGETIIPKGGGMAAGQLDAGTASLNGDTIEIPVRMINDGNRIGSRNKGRAGRA
jgi:hypothetical protein